MRPSSSIVPMEISSLLQASEAFFANVDPPTVNNLVRSILGRSSTPDETAQQIARHANCTRVLVHADVVPVLDEFLAYKRSHGSEKERLLYREMNREAFVRRLIRNRPLAFFDSTDITILRDGSEPRGREWELVGKGSEGSIRLEEYLSYDEIQIAALLGVSSPTLFINAGDRYNDAKLGVPGTFEQDGIYIGLVGARFEKPERMENQHLVVSEVWSRPKLGFGAGGDPAAAAQLHAFAALYSQPSSSASRNYFPSFEEALADRSGNFHRLFSNSRCFLNIAVYKARIRIPIECLLVEANDRGQEFGKKAYVFLVGLGLGVWKKCDEQAQWMVEVVADVLQSTALPHVADVDFSWFQKVCTNSRGWVPADPSLEQPAIQSPFISQSADRLPPSTEPKLLVASYAWDGNAFPGNEYWAGLTGSSGDPAAVCCSTIGELQNAWINTGFPDRQHLIQPRKL